MASEQQSTGTPPLSKLHNSPRQPLERAATAFTDMLVSLAAERRVPRESLRTMCTCGTLSPCYTLWFSDDTADRAFHDDIGKICPLDAHPDGRPPAATYASSIDSLGFGKLQFIASWN
jgi:hypothetical protein